MPINKGPWFFKTCLISLTGMLLWAAAQSLRAEVLLSEIMYNPDQSDRNENFNKEWVEIFNPGASVVDLGGWIFEDIQDATPALPIPAGTLLSPGQSLVLVGDATTFDAQWGSGINRIELGNFPTLSNSPSASNEILALKDSTGKIVDTVNYDDANSWPTDISDGPSIYVLPEFLNAVDNNQGIHWSSSTPGIDGAYYSQQAPFGEKASPGFVATTPTIFPPFTPSPDAVWSMVVFPDTQNYVKTQAHMPYFVDMVEWVRDNRDEFNIQLVLHEGDLVNKNNNENPSSGENPSTLQWENAQSTLGVLNGVVPYILSVGNHDVGINNGEDRTTRLNEFFSASDNPLVDPTQGGILQGVLEPGHLENAYYELTAPDGRELLIFSLAWDPQPEQLAWANQIAGQSKYEDHTAILVTHEYLMHDNTRSVEGENAWNGFVSQNENIEMVLNGHVGGDGTGYLASSGDDGNLVHQMVFNTQFEGNGGNGWIRLLEFLEDGKTVRARTYSTSFGYLREDIQNQFLFELSALEFSPADFDHNGVVNELDLEIWKTAFGMNSPGDTDSDEDSDGADFLAWQQQFGSGAFSYPASQNVPEPASLMMIGVLLGCFGIGFRHLS